MNYHIKELDDDFNIFPTLISTSIDNITELNNEYKYNFKFLKILNIYEISKWKYLSDKYKNLKKLISSNKHFYKKIINKFQLLYKYYDLDIIENKTKLIDEFKNMIDDNIFKLLNLQKEYKMIYYKLQLYFKKVTVIKVIIIPDNIKLLLDLEYNLYNDLDNMKNIIRKTRYKLIDYTHSILLRKGQYIDHCY
jgi:hypothetical protein